MSTSPQSENPFASPQSEDAGVAPNPTPAWRDGELVVVAPDGELPQRCIVCGKDAQGGSQELLYVQTHFKGWRLNLLRLLIFGWTVLSVAATLELEGRVRRPILNDSTIMAAMALCNLALSGLFVVVYWNNRSSALKSWKCRRHVWLARGIGIGSVAVLFALLFYLLPIKSLLMLKMLGIQSPLLVSSSSFFTGKSRVTKREGGFVWIKGYPREFWATLPPYFKDSITE